MPRLDPDDLLADLDPEQREAVLATSGPVAILAGAGTGKTRVISRRTAYAIATGTWSARTRSWSSRSRTRRRARWSSGCATLGLPGRHRAHVPRPGAAASCATSGRAATTGRRCRSCSTPSCRSSAASHASSRATTASRRPRTSPTRSSGRSPGAIRPRAYERGCGRPRPRAADPRATCSSACTTATSVRRRAPNRIDFDDLLLETVDAARGATRRPPTTVRARKRWFSVDEYQDTNPLQQRLLELWLGDRRDLCVVGDEDQTIYSFTGASSDVPDHVRGALAGRARGRAGPELPLDAAGAGAREPADRRRRAGRSGWSPRAATGRCPTIARHAIGARRSWTRWWPGSAARLGEGIAPAEIAVLVRMNAQLAPIEEALTRAGIAYQVRGVPLLRAAGGARRAGRACGAWPARARGGADSAATARSEAPLGRGRGLRGGRRPRARGDEARERQASLDTLLAIVDGGRSPRIRPPTPRPSSRSSRLGPPHEREGSADGVNLLTYHRAKGLEWDAVFLPALEEGILPIRQARGRRRGPRRGAPAPVRRDHAGPRCTSRLSWAERRETRRHARRAASRAASSLDLRPRRRAPDGHGELARAARRRSREPRGRQRLGRPAVRGAPRLAAPRRPARRPCRPTSSPTTPR